MKGGATHPSTRWSRRFQASATSPGEARSWLHSILTPIRNETDEEAAALLTTELLTNAIRHSASASVMVDVELTEDKLVVGVSDDEPSPPTMCDPRTEEDGGRGIALVARLSEQWGVSPRPTGKQVWFDLNRGHR